MESAAASHDSPPLNSELTGGDDDDSPWPEPDGTDSEGIGDDGDDDGDDDDGNVAGEVDDDTDFQSAAAATGVALPWGLPSRPRDGYIGRPGLDLIESWDLSADPEATAAVISGVR